MAKSKKKIAEQKKLIRAIKTPERFFKVEFGRYGGEVCMGTITKDQHEYWSDNDGFEQYMTDIEFDADEANKEIPKRAQFDKPFYEQDDICHMSGIELANGQTMTINEVDKDGEFLLEDHGDFVESLSVDMEEFEKLGVEVHCSADHHSGSKSCKDTHYIFGQYFNKGGWYSQAIQTGPEGFDFKKMSIKYENADGFKVFNSFDYDGAECYLEEDSSGKGSSFYVMAGDDV